MCPATFRLVIAMLNPLNSPWQSAAIGVIAKADDIFVGGKNAEVVLVV